MSKRKDEIGGLAGTIIFHALLLLALFFMALRTPLPLPSEGGVEVNLGNSDQGMGVVQPKELQSATPATPPPPITTKATEELVTDNTEEAPALEPKKEPKPKPVEKPQPKPEVKKEPEPVPEPQPKTDPRALFPGKTSTGNPGQGGNEGITGKPGDQGKPFGDPNASGYDGTGGSGGGPGGVGGGISFSLEGRSSRQIPKPSNNFRESGTVVVTIYVNRQGNVTRAVAGAKGTTTSNTQLRQLAEQAARQAKFSPKEDAAEEQRGTITYIFELN